MPYTPVSRTSRPLVSRDARVGEVSERSERCFTPWGVTGETCFPRGGTASVIKRCEGRYDDASVSEWGVEDVASVASVLASDNESVASVASVVLSL